MEQRQEIYPEQNQKRQQGMTSIERARELFEYEMTEVLLNFQNEVKTVKGGTESEYLGMDVPKAGVEYHSPDIRVEGIGYRDTGTKVAIDSDSLRIRTIAVFNGEIPSAEVVVPQKETAASVDASAFAAAAVGIPELRLEGGVPEVKEFTLIFLDAAPAEIPWVHFNDAAPEEKEISFDVTAPNTPAVSSESLFTAPRTEVFLSVAVPAVKTAALPVEALYSAVPVSADVTVPLTESVSLPVIPEAVREPVVIHTAEAAAPVLPVLSVRNEAVSPIAVPAVSAVEMKYDMSVPQVSIDVAVPEASAAFDDFPAPTVPRAEEIICPSVPAQPDYAACCADITEALKSEQ